ncbi:class I SAM-dependent methyltransferase [Gilvimarinus sp. DA14]|uniref:class I SAM-dependent methyltransferase n=1 Tax=Gilvimarinus sp. DA14 TaxID=2956798 RepID=UPI0020B7190E|nr:class I SAM-dependent methyltransferase [Gilvimarinus sp. DA14]UTF58838.1 class I SAM-dependent methyltransferase [Gilvimarinus sp. DA14]
MTSDLRDRVIELCNSPEFQKVLQAHCLGVSAAKLNTHIYAGDQMLDHSLKHHNDANAATSQYYNVALQQFNTVRQILELTHIMREPAFKFLDFACGYGRLIRFLSEMVEKEKVTGADIQKNATEFVEQEFGVKTLVSYPCPDDFKPGEQYQVIWVASLFSHLPKALFKQWLTRLAELLAPNGILCFSVHDAALLQGTRNFSEEEGFLYLPESENADLDTSIYGNTFVNEQFVLSTIHDVCGEARTTFRLPKGLAHEQDVYVVGGTERKSLAVLNEIRRGPWGWVDERMITREKGLYLRGWAASIDDGALRSVNITIDGKQYTCPTGLSRPDVGRAFENTALNSSGWEFCIPYEKIADKRSIYVLVSAETDQQEKALLYTGFMEVPTDA